MFGRPLLFNSHSKEKSWDKSSEVVTIKESIFEKRKKRTASVKKTKKEQTPEKILKRNASENKKINKELN